MSSHFVHSKLLWTPTRLGHTNIDHLRRFINRKHGFNLTDYYQLHKYSVEDYTFWQDLWEFLGIIYSQPSTKILEQGAVEELPIWFPGARLNYAENLLYRNDDTIACTASGESGSVKHYSFRTLRKLVGEMAAAMKVTVSNPVIESQVTIITNSITAVVIALATTSIGAIFSTTATDMGTQGILDRYRQIQPKFVFAETQVQYVGKLIDLMPKISQVVQDLSDKGLRRAILLPSAVTGAIPQALLPNSITLPDFLTTGDGRPLTFEQLPFNHPVYILYSSGTSGKPKCIVHSAGGVLLQGKKDMRLNFDLNPDETYFQYTTTAWMMWPYMLAGLACGARLILYDGSPFYPTLETYLKFIHDQGVNLLGTSPRFLAEVQGRNIKPLELASFDALRTIGCTGAPLTAPLFEWAQNAFGKRVHLISTSGGTDIHAALVTGAACLPVHCGELQAKALGMKIEVFDPSGNNIEHTGEAGELMCTRPHPSLPLRFWGDTNFEKLRDAYYSMYPGIWRQGDFIVVNPVTKGMLILGRSDGVLNPSGVRFGSGEIYAVMEQFSAEIDDSLCIGQRRPHDDHERVLLFVKMRTSAGGLKPQLEDRIRIAIRTALSARHVPAFIFQIEDIPYTVNGKKIEIAVKQIVSGINVQPSGTVANPESLQLYYKYRDIERIVGQVKARM
ncbi:hypothetical protein AMATHDRAFT_73172 [Amanita thiersii Skay4041]|uniref:Uncharacterized protein n=1 Tax=Amanita thiersii Skay4041 TaxID=703135 RepID=A0A2A9NT71_9AGAR|nr:hypothetical protein AMATHDRAFT_73172 [Amanita thiersii Skay4041]